MFHSSSSSHIYVFLSSLSLSLPTGEMGIKFHQRTEYTYSEKQSQAEKARWCNGAPIIIGGGQSCDPGPGTIVMSLYMVNVEPSKPAALRTIFRSSAACLGFYNTSSPLFRPYGTRFMNHDLEPNIGLTLLSLKPLLRCWKRFANAFVFFCSFSFLSSGIYKQAVQICHCCNVCHGGLHLSTLLSLGIKPPKHAVKLLF